MCIVISNSRAAGWIWLKRGKTVTKKNKPATKKATIKKSKRILMAGEPAPARVENEKGRGQCIVVCDHASNRVPKSLGTLGLKKSDLEKHIAWDPGTEIIGRHIAQKIDAPLVCSSYSRLVVDVNRGEKSPECMRAVYDHIVVPGNAGLTAANKKQRITEIFTPYHKTLARTIRARVRKDTVPVILSIHSFTPKMDDYLRPWHIGILWNREEKIARRLVRNLRINNPGMVVGENEPYSLKAANLQKNTITTHAESKGLPYIIVEFRQDLVKSAAGARKWAKILLQSLDPILSDPGVYRRRKNRR
jgi:predicted N-formylglutamate amidohydrolase